MIIVDKSTKKIDSCGSDDFFYIDLKPSSDCKFKGLKYVSTYLITLYICMRLNFFVQKTKKTLKGLVNIKRPINIESHSY